MSDSRVLLTVRGKYIPKTLEAVRVLHNDTAGSEPGIAAARALGDLSHKVYAPASGADGGSGAKAGEILFLDAWLDAEGIQKFFSNEHVKTQATQLFASKDATVWMPARGSFSFDLPAPMGKNDRYVGIVRGKVSSPEKAIEAFRAAGTRGLPDGRRRGQLSHAIYLKLAHPGDSAPMELLGVDVWASFAGMMEQYGDATHMAPLGAAFDGRPETSVWEQPKGLWSEW